MADSRGTAPDPAATIATTALGDPDGVAQQCAAGAVGAGRAVEEFIPFVKAVGRGEKLKRDLTRTEAAAAMAMMLNGEASAAQIGAFLIAQRVKGESVDEILGFTELLRAQAVHQISPRVENLLDLAVPYDGKVKTAQLAPAVALVLVAAGVPVVLHGDEGVPTKAGIGPGPVLQGLGLATALAPQAVQAQIEATGIGYLAAAVYAPAWHALLPIRRQFGLRTVLNTVEKLFNPANAPYQVSGFFHGNYIDRLRSTQTGVRQSWIVQGEEGSIEMAAGRKTPIYAVSATGDCTLDPAALGMADRERVAAEPTVAAHVGLNAAVLAGQPSPATDQVTLTAGALLWLLQAAPTLAAGVETARQLLTSGAAQARLERAIAFQPDGC